MSTMAEPIASTPSLEQLVRDDVIEALMDEGFSRAEAESGVACGTGVTYSALFTSSMNWLMSQRKRSRPTTTPPKESPMPEVQPTTAKPNGHAPAKRYCPGYERECGEVLRDKNTSGLCTKCYARKNYHDNKGPKQVSAKPAQKPAKRAAAKTVSVAPPIPLARDSRGHRSPARSISRAIAARRQAAARQSLPADRGVKSFRPRRWA